MRVALPSTPASYFHLLRRQALSPKKKPLVVFTPKSLLRHRAAVSQVAEFATGTFQPVIADVGVDAAAVSRVLLCTGKLYYDLIAARAERGITDTAIVRLEQLYPLPVDEVKAALAAYPVAQDFVWVQEEPANQGPWPFMALNLPEHLEGRGLLRASRRAAASPAVGSVSVHEAQQREVVATAFTY
jgi:2-oxoglutarate dehydrogenase E1 component